VSLRSLFPVGRFHETLSDGGKLLVIKSALMRTSLMSLVGFGYMISRPLLVLEPGKVLIGLGKA